MIKKFLSYILESPIEIITSVTQALADRALIISISI